MTRVPTYRHWPSLLDDLVSLGAERDWSSIYWHTRASNAQAHKLDDRYAAADDSVRYRLAIRPLLLGQLKPST